MSRLVTALEVTQLALGAGIALEAGSIIGGTFQYIAVLLWTIPLSLFLGQREQRKGRSTG